MGGVLDAILASTRARLPRLLVEADALAAAAARAPASRDFAAPLRGSHLGVIAEMKRRSPSAGPIAPDLVPGDLAADYRRGGASAMSVLTEQEFFGGSLADLEAVRRRVETPVLRKDFIIHEVQIDESRAAGADAVLLIVSALEESDLAALVSRTADGGMTAMVEAHDADEVRRAIDAGASVVGVNNRDLKTFGVDLGTAERLRTLIPDEVVAVAESGIRGPEDALRMAAAGFDAILVGQAAVQSGDPAAFIASLGSP